MTPPDRYDIFIIGGYGHVGLPLGIALAHAGFQVGLRDVDKAKGRIIAEGRMPFMEVGGESMLRSVLGRNLHIERTLPEIAASDCVIVTVGTPLDEYLNPKLLPILDLAEEMSRYLQAGQHVLLRSTLFPGTSERFAQFFSSRDLDIHVSVCPERVVQGHAIAELGTLAQIVAGFSDEAVRRAVEIFARLGVTTVTTTVKEAELAKLFSNAWRYLQFAIANQFYMIATEYGADFHRIHHAMTVGYERAQDFPSAGFAAGPCIFKDTLQLAAFYRNNFALGHAAILVNEGLPNFIADSLRKGLGADLVGQRVGILGMAFKADIDDIRDSLSYKLAKVLRFRGATVVCSDEYVQDRTFVSKEEVLATCRIVIVGVPHSAYRGLQVPEGTHTVDLWNVLA